MKLTVNDKSLQLQQLSNDVVEDMDIILKEMEETDQASLEGIGSDMLERVSAAFRRLYASFKDNLINLVSDLDRSELRHYADIHKAKLEKVFNTRYHRLMNEEAYCPDGMEGTYRQIVDMLLKMYSDLNMVETMTQAEQGLDDYYKSLSKGKDDAATYLNGLLKSMASAGVNADAENIMETVYAADVKNSEELRAQQQRITQQILRDAADRAATMDEFEKPTKSDADKKFKDVFGSVSEYKSVFEDLLAQEERLGESRKVDGMMTSVDETLGSITEMVENETVDREHITGLASIVKSLALNISHYGFAVATQMKLEHNFILTNQVVAKSL